MSRRRLAADICIGLCCLVAPFAVSAESRCARGEGDFCLVKVAKGPSARDARTVGWAQWASGSRMRPGGAVAPETPAVDSDEPEAASGYIGRIPLDAAAPGVRPNPRLGYGARLQPADPAAAAIHGSYFLGESFSLDVTAGRGRIGLRTATPEPAYGAGTGLFPWPAYDRTAWSVALNATRQIGALGIGGRIGYVDLRDQPESLFDGGSSLRLGGERTATLRRSFLGIDASYDVARNWQLHGAAVYRRDEGRPGMSMTTGFGAMPFADRDEKEWGVGVRYYGWRNFKLNVEYLRTSGRDQFGNESLLFMGRFDF